MSSYAKQQKELELVGYYHANERYDDTELSTSARRVADKLYSNTELACALLVRHADHWKIVHHFCMPQHSSSSFAHMQINSPKLKSSLQSKAGNFLQVRTGSRVWYVCICIISDTART